jgi:hypothetical protein
MAAQALSREAILDILRRLEVAHADEALANRALELHLASAEQMARLARSFDKSIEPAHVFAVPLR